MNGNYNSAYGLDSRLRIFNYDYLSIKWAQSFETGFENNPFSTDPAKISISWEKRKEEGFAYDFSYSRSGEEFNPGIGFEMREDYSFARTQFQYGWLPGKDSKLFSHSIFIQQMYFQSLIDGNLETFTSTIGPEAIPMLLTNSLAALLAARCLSYITSAAAVPQIESFFSLKLVMK
jgi:hypothetical protein